MKLKETIIKEIEEMDMDELLLLYEQMELLKKRKSYPESKPDLIYWKFEEYITG